MRLARASISWGFISSRFGDRLRREGVGGYLVHVHADCSARGADLGGGEEDIEAGAATEVDDCFTLF